MKFSKWISAVALSVSSMIVSADPVLDVKWDKDSNGSMDYTATIADNGAGDLDGGVQAISHLFSIGGLSMDFAGGNNIGDPDAHLGLFVSSLDAGTLEVSYAQTGFTGGDMTSLLAEWGGFVGGGTSEVELFVTRDDCLFGSVGCAAELAWSSLTAATEQIHLDLTSSVTYGLALVQTLVFDGTPAAGSSDMNVAVPEPATLGLLGLGLVGLGFSRRKKA